MSGEYDFCEYVYNPLMRQYQAMMRLMQIISDSQSQQDCNDIECFSPNDPNSPMNVLSNVDQSGVNSLTTYLPMLMIWALFAFALFMFRPNSMRTTPERQKSVHPNTSNNPRNNDEDDDSFAS